MEKEYYWGCVLERNMMRAAGVGTKGGVKITHRLLECALDVLEFVLCKLIQSVSFTVVMVESEQGAGFFFLTANNLQPPNADLH
ncbi:hypothetical protein TNCV_4783721 [Trichonephila clavipes]|nr:hypothetical protein TNCV_4783721 [Trichonephila clavipes]